MLEPEKSEHKEDTLLETFLKTKKESFSKPDGLWTNNLVNTQSKIVCYILTGITIGMVITFIYFLAIK